MANKQSSPKFIQTIKNIWILTDKGVARYRRQSDDFFIPTNESGNNIIVYSVCLTKGGVLFGSKNKIFFYNYQDASLRLLQSFEREPNYNVTLLTLWDEHTLLWTMLTSLWWKLLKWTALLPCRLSGRSSGLR